MGPLEFGILSASRIVKDEYQDDKLAEQLQSLAGFAHEFVPRDHVVMSNDGKRLISSRLRNDIEIRLKDLSDELGVRAKLKREED